MGIEWYRDLVIVVFGVIATLVALATLILVVSLYRKTNALFERSDKVVSTLERTANNIESFAQTGTRELMKPIIEIVAMFHGLKAGFGSIFRRR